LRISLREKGCQCRCALNPLEPFVHPSTNIPNPMNPRLLLAPFFLITTAAFAADLPAIPAEPIAKKKELLFSDDFEGSEPAKVWHKVVPTFAVENGALKGTQTRDQNIPAADGKPAVTAHAAVH